METGSLTIVNYRRKTDALLERLRSAKRQIREEKTRLHEAESEKNACLEAQQLLQSVAEKVQKIAHLRMSKIVTSCLQAVFGKEEAYQFKIEFVQQRGKTEAKLLFARDGHELTPMESSGGGVIDIAALALSLASLALTKPGKRLLRVTDEPFKNLSPEYQVLVPPLLETLSREMGVQFIFSTNLPAIACGKVVKLE
jgi:DNA repair exonuclease SbcCD ATPase subunit